MPGIYARPGMYASKHFGSKVKKTKTQEKTQSWHLEKTKTHKLQLESSARAGTVNSPRFSQIVVLHVHYIMFHKR